MTATEAEYRTALQLAERALTHAEKLAERHDAKDVQRLILVAREEVSRVLDLGRDESNEMVLT